ncbi:MAG: ABC transporter permease [Cytophagales bacterium]|nr:ABC transporter permease [Cytophagales bacterium]
MLNFLFKVSWRGLRRNWLFSAINVIGLSLGMMAFMLIMAYVKYENSYDKHVPDFESIYRIIQIAGEERPRPFAITDPALGPAVNQALPEVSKFGRLIPTDKLLSNYSLSYFQEGNSTITFNYNDAYFADPGIVELFLHDWVAGDRDEALIGPNEIILAASEARRFFGASNPIGKILMRNGKEQLTVVGVFQDTPNNTHLSLKVLVSMKTLPERLNLNQDWDWRNYMTYIKSDTDIGLQEKIEQIVHEQKGREMTMPLQRLADIHLESKAEMDISTNGNGDSIRFLEMIAWVIILIAAINFFNFFTARAIDRIKEVSLKKVIGSNYWQMVAQFQIEVFLVSLVACMLAATCVQLISPLFMEVLDVTFIYSWKTQLVQSLSFIGAMLLFSFYPAFWLSKRGSLDMLRRVSSRLGGVWIRKILVILQFAFTTILLIGTIVIDDQKSFMISKPKGFDKDQLLAIKFPAIMKGNREQVSDRFIAALKNYPEFGEVGRAAHLPGYEVTRGRVVTRVDSVRDWSGPRVIGADEGYFTSLNHQLLAGRLFDDAFNDDRSIILNEKAIQDLEFHHIEKAIGTTVMFEEKQYQLIGIVSNYHQTSLRTPYPAVAFVKHPWLYQYFTIKIQGWALEESVTLARTLYSELYPDDYFEYFFLDEYFNEQFIEDIKFGKITTLFSGLAIFIALFGLSGLTLFAANQRIKEISVRKVLGAGFRHLLWLFNSSFSKLILIAFVVSAPLAYYLMSDWLTNFSYQISLHWGHFLVPLIMVLAMALVITAAIVVRIAQVNPAETLRSE